MATRRQVLGLGAAFGGLLAAAPSCANIGNTSAGGEGQLIVGSYVQANSWNPAKAQQGHYTPFFQAAYDSLVTTRPDGTIAPMLATAWEWDGPKTSLTMTLRDGVTFSDGATFDAAAAKTAVEQFLTGGGPLSATIRSIKSVEAPDASTLVLHLAAPDPGLLSTLAVSASFVASPAAYADPRLEQVPVGSGPYVMDTRRTTTGVRYSFVRRPDYWGEPAAFDRVTFEVLVDSRARLNALKAGQIDGAFFSSASDTVEGQSAGFANASGFPNFEGLMLYDRDGRLTPALGDVRVRQAINYALDRRGILHGILLDQGAPTAQIFGPDDDGYDETLDDAYPHDPGKARALLAEAGFARGFEVVMPVSSAYESALYDAMIQNLQDVGIRCRRRELAPGESLPVQQKGEVSLSCMTLGFQGDYRTMTTYVGAKGSWNPFKTTDPAVAGFIERYQYGDVSAARELNHWLVENAWFAPMYRPASAYLHSSAIDVTVQSRAAVPSLHNIRPSS